MEYVRNMDDLMLQINGCRSNEAVMKVFNVLFPYDLPLPRGTGDELSAANFYGNGRQEDDLKEYHPDRLRKILDDETDQAVLDAIKKNKVDDIVGLQNLQNELHVL